MGPGTKDYSMLGLDERIVVRAPDVGITFWHPKWVESFMIGL